jgi:hypothetical protein
MDKRFKFYMLITSFIPLWVSIAIIDVRSIIKTIDNGRLIAF